MQVKVIVCLNLKVIVVSVIPIDASQLDAIYLFWYQYMYFMCNLFEYYLNICIFWHY